MKTLVIIIVIVSSIGFLSFLISKVSAKETSERMKLDYQYCLEAREINPLIECIGN